MISQLIGNEPIKKILLNLKPAGSFLFAGPDGVGKSLFAEAFAERILGSLPHPDLFVFRPEGKTAQHSIDSVRRLTEEVYRSPYQAPVKIFIIHEAERMMATSSNALLKTFEEPLPTSVIILLTSKKERILPTILSRCQTLHFHALAPEEIEQCGIPPEIAKSARGSLSYAKKLLEGNPARDYLLKLLSTSAFHHYPTLVEASKELAALLEARAPEEKSTDTPQTAHQKEAHQKEYEGSVRLALAEEFYALLDELHTWYRDRVLLQAGGDVKYLFHPEHHNGDIIPLKKVEKEISSARLSFERSTSLQICFERLFLSLT